MKEIARRRIHGASSFLVFAASATLLAACATDNSAELTRHHSKEYFSEKAYGVKASPRVSFKRSRLPRGGGREQVGDPYEVAGKWYYPKDYKHYSAVGAASWYGDAFHGRLTANGEIYDDTALTAAHPTLPLPCYARVTNLLNGSSVIVRVNDRGPYAPGRIIDLSKRAAQLLDYSTTGVAKVRVDYMGKAPLEGNDEPFLLASYRPGKGEGMPGQEQAPSVMMAMNGATPTRQAGGSIADRLDETASPSNAVSAVASSSHAALALAALSQAKPTPAPVAVTVASSVGPGDPVLPSLGPIVPDRPDVLPASIALSAVSPMAYADRPVGRAAAAFDLVVKPQHRLTAGAIVASWKRQQGATRGRGDVPGYVAVGSFANAATAEKYSKDLSPYGHAEIRASRHDGGTFYSLVLYPDGHASVDRILRQAWAVGATDAITVRE